MNDRIRKLFAKSPTKQFRAKHPDQQRLVLEAIDLLHRLGVPIDGRTPRDLEGMAVSFLAVVDVSKPGQWSMAKDLRDSVSMSTRKIIAYVNERVGENISMGSYDDVRRSHLKLP